MLVILLLGLSAAAVYLAHCGVPDALMRSLLQRVEERGLIIEIDRAGLDLYRGVWIRGLVVHGSRRDILPLFSAEEVRIWIRPDARLPLEKWVRGLHINGGMAHVRLRDAAEVIPEPEFLIIEDISLSFSVMQEGWRIDHGRLKTGMLTLDIQGIIQRGEEREETVIDVLLERLHTGVALKMAEEMGVDSAQYFRNLEELDWPQSARAVLTFNVLLDDLPASEMRVYARAEEFAYRGMLVEEMHAVGGWWQGRLVLEECQLKQDAFRLRGAATWDQRSGLISANGYGKLPPAHVEHLMPDILKQLLLDEGVFVNGTVEGEAALGPATFANLIEIVSGWARVEDLHVRGVRVDHARMQVERLGDRVDLRGIEAHVDGGWMRGDALYILPTRYLEAQGEGEIDPGSFVPLFSRGLKNLLMATKFHQPTLHVRGVCRGNIDDIKRFQAHGFVEATDFIFRGSHIDRFESTVRIAGKTIRFDPFVLSRHDGQVQGWVLIDPDDDIVETDAHSTIHPKAAARIIGPALSSALRNFQFNGPVDIKAAGIVYYSDWDGSRLAAEVSGQQMGMQNLIAEEMQFKVTLQDARMEVVDLRGKFYGGTVEGSATIDLEQKGNTVYNLKGIVKGASLADMVQDLRQMVDAEPYEGMLNIDGWVNGRVVEGENRWKEGEFNARVREGRLFQIPLLGGLSEYLSLIYDGFGYLSQTEFVVEGEIHPDRIRLMESELQGTVISVRARGSAYFDERLDVNVEVQLLRRGFLAQLLRLVTRPVTRLFEFKLTGTLDAPQWWPRNIPKQLFLLRDEE